VAISPNERHIAVIAGPYGSFIFFGTIEEGNHIREVRKWKYEEPSIRQVGVRFLPNGKCLFGFVDVACTEDYVYTIYAGKNAEEHGSTDAFQGSHLLVYDWDGNPVRQYLLEKPLRSLGYDEASKTIYGISYDPEGVLIEYKLGD
jgi:hypothetical protein